MIPTQCEWPGRDPLFSRQVVAELYSMYETRVREAESDPFEQRRLIVEWVTLSERELRGLDDDESRSSLALCRAIKWCLSTIQVDVVTDVRIARRFGAIVAGMESGL